MASTTWQQLKHQHCQHSYTKSKTQYYTSYWEQNQLYSSWNQDKYKHHGVREGEKMSSWQVTLIRTPLFIPLPSPNSLLSYTNELKLIAKQKAQQHHSCQSRWFISDGLECTGMKWRHIHSQELNSEGFLLSDSRSLLIQHHYRKRAGQQLNICLWLSFSFSKMASSDLNSTHHEAKPTCQSPALRLFKTK